MTGSCPDGPIVSHSLAIAQTMVEADGTVRANGGRVLAITGLGDSVAAARDAAYGAVASIDWPEGFYRRDIAAV